MHVNHMIDTLRMNRLLTAVWKRMMLGFVICGGHVDGVSTSAHDAPASAASSHSLIVSFVDCSPVPAITSTCLKPFSSRVCRVRRMACLRSSWERCCASPLLPCTRIPVTPPLYWTVASAVLLNFESSRVLPGRDAVRAI